MLVAACVGEGFVEYEGTVLEGRQAGHSFDPAPNPGGLPPVIGATVSLRVCSGSCSGDEAAQFATSGPDGAWGPVDLAFGAGVSDHEIRIDVAAPGFAPYTYRTVYETTDDPTVAERFLNVTLAPSG